MMASRSFCIFVWQLVQSLCFLSWGVCFTLEDFVRPSANAPVVQGREDVRISDLMFEPRHQSRERPIRPTVRSSDLSFEWPHSKLHPISPKRIRNYHLNFESAHSSRVELVQAPCSRKHSCKCSITSQCV